MRSTIGVCDVLCIYNMISIYARQNKTKQNKSGFRKRTIIHQEGILSINQSPSVMVESREWIKFMFFLFLISNNRNNRLLIYFLSYKKKKIGCELISFGLWGHPSIRRHPDLITYVKNESKQWNSFLPFFYKLSELDLETNKQNHCDFSRGAENWYIHSRKLSRESSSSSLSIYLVSN